MLLLFLFFICIIFFAFVFYILTVFMGFFAYSFFILLVLLELFYSVCVDRQVKNSYGVECLSLM